MFKFDIVRVGGLAGWRVEGGFEGRRGSRGDDQRFRSVEVKFFSKFSKKISACLECKKFHFQSASPSEAEGRHVVKS